MTRSDYTKGAAWQNGRIMPVAEAKIGVTDWGLTRSDITYDVVHVWDGAFFRLEDYLDRFEASMDALRLDVGMDRAAIRDALVDMVATSGLRRAYVSMVASRGTPHIPGTRDPRACANHFYAWCVPFVWVIPPEVMERGPRMALVADRQRIDPAALDPRVKNYHWGDMTGALFDALDAGFDTCVLCDARGHVTEGPGFNVFVVRNGRVITPRAGMLEGITRRTVLGICESLGIPTEVRDIEAAEFLEAEELFTATTAGGVVPFTGLNDRTLGNGAPGPLGARIKDTYWDWHQRSDLCTQIDYHPIGSH